ncbi:PQ loop repeat-domain-containing protein [Sporodiniella umbellata]|nr:PQ loop repeat-domain-containing protein [Sporodiniella umbellata]
MSNLVLDIVSDIIGWTYFSVWSISFYPQVYLNWQRKSVRGLSMDFLFYNVLGFFCYSVYTCSFYFNKEIQDEYKHRHGDHHLVRMNDVVFAVHGFVLSFFVLLQTCIYKKHAQHISSFAASFVWFGFIGAVLMVSAIYYGNVAWIDLLYYTSSIKLVVDFIKYLPQVWLNCKRQSAQGLSLQYVCLDLSGAVLSIVQLLLDAYIVNDWSGIEGVNENSQKQGN